MRAVAQRVSRASVEVDDQTVGSIEAGLLVYLGVSRDDGENEARALADKISGLRVFDDEQGVMNLSVGQVGGAVLAISAFTTQGDARRGRRPSYEAAAQPEQAEPLYEAFCRELSDRGVPVQQGRFRAKMNVSSINDGPICILLDTNKTF